MIKICTGKGNEADVSSWRNAGLLRKSLRELPNQHIAT